MASHDKLSELLVGLGNPAERRTRTELMDRALRTLLVLMDADASSVLIPSSTRAERLVLHAGSVAPAKLPLPADGSGVLRRLAADGQPLMVDLSDDARVAEADGCPGVDPGPVMFAPLRQRDAAPAYLAAYRRRGRARFNVNDTRALLLLAAWLGAELDNLRLATGTQRLVVTDTLTGVYNYRFLKTALKREIRRASRFAHELTLLMVEVDDLQAYVAEHGTLRGNLLLKELVPVLAQHVRSFDVMGTCGGGRCMLILPETGRDGGAEVAERLRAAAEQHAFSGAEPGAVTVSLGVGTFPQDAGDLRDLIAATTRALEHAGERGRNVVVPARRAA